MEKISKMVPLKMCPECRQSHLFIYDSFKNVLYCKRCNQRVHHLLIEIPDLVYE